MRLTLNWRYLLKLAAVGLIAGLGVHFLHRWQVGRQVGALLRQADVARAGGDPVREAKYVRRYLSARPDDTAARERLGRLMCRTAKTGRDLLEAYLVLDDVLRRDPDRDELRRFAVDFATAPRTGLFAEARGHLEVLMRKRPGDGELEGLYARCLAAEGMYARAAEWYEQSVAHRPDLVDSYAGGAAVLRLRLNQPDAADAVIKHLLEKNPGRFRAHLAVAGYWRAAGRPEQPAAVVARAVADAQKLGPDEPVWSAIGRAVAEARKLAPDELDVILLSADAARTRRRHLAREGDREGAGAAADEARRVLTGGLDHPAHRASPGVYLALAGLEAELGRLPAAIDVLEKGLRDPDRVPDSPELALALLDYRIAAGDAAAAGEVLDRLRAGGLPPAQTDYQRARLLALNDGWPEAAALLERVRQDLPNDPGLARQVSLLLGRCYEQCGEHDRRLDAYRRAVPAEAADPLWVPAMVGVAEAQAALGQGDAALETYRKLADLAPGAWVKVVRLEMIRALRAPAEARDWGPAAEALAKARRAALREAADLPTEVVVLEADLDYLRNNPSGVRKRLEELLGRRPHDAAARIALAVQDQREGNPRQAAATLDRAEKDLGDSPELRLARARLWAGAKDPDLARRVADLAAGAERFGRPRQRYLLRGLAEVAAAAGAADAAAGLWEQVAAAQPYDLGVHLVRFDRAVRAGDAAAAERVLGDIRRVNGEAGPFARLGRAVYLIGRARQANDRSGLGEAGALLDGLERERAGWSRVALGQALVHDLQGKPDLALAKYRQAVELGESGPEALRRLMVLLHAKGRFAEADDVFRRLPGATAADPEVQRLAAEVSLRTENLKQALEFASRAIPESSTNPQDHIWLGQVYWRAGDPAKAEARFRAAAALRPESPDGWLILIRYLAATDRKDEGERVLGEAREKVGPADRALLLGLSYAQLGKVEEAVGAFRRARAERPADLRTIQAEAEFLFQAGRLADARERFEQLLGLQASSPEDKEFARRMLALCLAADRDYPTSRKALEALGLLDGDALRPPAGTETPARRRARIAALALQRDRASKLEAVRLLEATGGSLAPADQFLLAQLHAAVGNRPQVRLVMADLLRKSDRVPLYVGFYADWLLREGDAREAEGWVNRLDQLQPGAFGTAQLKARLYAAKKDLGSARAVLVRQADDPGAPVGLIARACEDAGLYDDAERLFHRYAEQGQTDRPQASLAVAAFYARRGRTADALLVCEQVRAKVPASAWGGVAVAALYAAHVPAAGDVAKVAGWLEGAAGAPGAGRSVLLQQLAAVRNLQGDYAAAMTLYRRVTEADGRDAVAMNNLAYLLSAREGRHDDALRLLERAKAVAGPNPSLMDTEALVRLNRGEAEAARKLLEAVAAEAPSGPAYFHLARAELAAGRELEARAAWLRAGELALRPADLHPLERPAYEQVAARMK